MPSVLLWMVAEYFAANSVDHSSTSRPLLAEDGRAVAEAHPSAILRRARPRRLLQFGGQVAQLCLRHFHDVGPERLPCLLASRENEGVVSA